MIKWRNIQVGLFVLLLASSGCLGLQSGNDTVQSETPHSDGDGSGVELGMGRIELRADTLQRSDSGFVFEGDVRFELYLSDTESFDGAMLCLYNENGTLLNATHLGTLTTPNDVAETSVRTDEPPTYVFVFHPEFKEYPELEAGVIHFQPDHSYVRPTMNYTQLYRTLPFDYPQQNEEGRCG